ncbi:hypothetical protein [Flavobacterium sp.]|uniref:hypothetical protein n=1 Tax=Flavobacterium sp. TaxID=239 RepID=UPI00286E2191|nr:hypothetical protein [Flavobacterium sp.]
MENQDKIFEQFKNAAQKSETKDFEALEKVWSRVDAKLDTKVQKTQNKNWKKFAIAASVLLVISISYLLYQSNYKVILINKKVVVLDSIQTEKAIVTSDETEAIINTETDKKIQEVIKNAPEVVVNSNQNPEASPIQANEEIVVNESLTNSKNAEKETKSKGYLLRGNVFEAIGVRHIKSEDITIENNKVETQVVTPTSSPLVVIDGNAKTHRKGSRYGETEKEALSKLDSDEVENVVILKEPLYIINGVEYSEEDLFGKNPTSPYAPLDRQEIEKIEILQDEDAIEKFGKKGEKGVVIISTKNRKPVSKK